uniref:WW domain-containing protein n=1 Tax=Mantoniella antarctica TaxID=81844 RepID=A0A7S0SVQ6_9CHLO|mmetsp:Transcript_35249/g.88139  ORF Transcript_35249/g.88139 Transcript_35249/m.88139 type:complete len:546 (+) Transcript_35249:714-2351(+)
MVRVAVASGAAEVMVIGEAPREYDGYEGGYTMGAQSEQEQELNREQEEQHERYQHRQHRQQQHQQWGAQGGVPGALGANSQQWPRQSDVFSLEPATGYDVPSVSSLLEEAADSTAAEISSYARHLGIDTEGEPDLLWIAEQAYSAPAPDQWEEYVDSGGQIYYFNVVTGVSTWTHPLEDQFRTLVMRCRADKHQVAKAKEAEETRARLSRAQDGATAANPPLDVEEEVEDEEEEGSFYEDYQTGEFASYEFRLEDEQEKSRVSKSGIPVPRSKESPHAPTRAGLSLSLTFGTSSKGLSLRARRLRDLSGSGTDVGLGGSERGVFHSSKGEGIEDGALSLDGRGRRESSVAQRIFSGGDDGVGARAGSLGASAAVVAAFAAAAAATGGMLAQPPPPDTPPPKHVLGIIVPPGLKQTAAAASGVPYGSFHISGYGREEAAVGAATAAGSPRVETSRGTSGASAPHDVLHVSGHGGPGDRVGNEEDNDDIMIVLGESVRCHAGLGGRHDCNGDVDEGKNTERAGEITGGVRQGLVWNLEPGISSSPAR